jgi:hypothetical protein
MLNGKEYNDASKKTLETRLKQAQEEAKKIPINGIKILAGNFVSAKGEENKV